MTSLDFQLATRGPELFVQQRLGNALEEHTVQKSRKALLLGVSAQDIAAHRALQKLGAKPASKNA